MSRVELRWSLEMEEVIRALGLSYGYGSGRDGSERLVVDVDAAADGMLERVISSLAELRWGYGPGRMLQLTLPGTEKLLAGALPLEVLPLFSGEGVR